jgi:hypothetical protein
MFLIRNNLVRVSTPIDFTFLIMFNAVKSAFEMIKGVKQSKK